MTMAAPQNMFDVRRSVGLTPIERRVLEICEQAAEEGRELDSIETMTEAIGATGVSTVPGIMKRLEGKGFISRTVYQKGRRVCISATGKCTLPPNNTAPHWRNRIEGAPAPTIQAISQRSKPLAQMIETEARRLGKPIAEFLMDCVYVGFHEIHRESECEE